MGLPSGTLWANRNIDVQQRDGFAQSPYQYSCSFFSWGNVEGHDPTSDSSFSPYSWGGINSESPYYEGQVYGSTPGHSLTVNVPQNKDFDAARAIVGTPWRLPSNTDFAELLQNCEYIDEEGNIVEGTNKIVTVNYIHGVYLRSKINGQKLFFACCGYGSEQNWLNRGAAGFYMSSYNVDERVAVCMRINQSGVSNNLREKYFGYAVRPISRRASLQLTRLNVSHQALASKVELLDQDDVITPIERPIIQPIDSI